MAPPLTPIQCITFGDISGIVQNRAKIAGTIQQADLQFIQGSINEHYLKISNERNWPWRYMDRDFIFNLKVNTGTVNVTNGSRNITFSGLTPDITFLSRSIKVIGDVELYRIVGFNSSTQQAFLASPYIKTTNSTAQFNLYQYEFAVPPDCDNIIQIYLDDNLADDGELEYLENSEFNRYLAKSILIEGPPIFYTRNSQVELNASLPVLDQMVLDYDFLAGEDTVKVDKFRIFPVGPDQARLLHLVYTRQVEPLSDPKDVPLIPVNERWVLVHFALSDWWRTQGNLQMASMEQSEAMKQLREMRDKHRKTDEKPRMKVDGRRFIRDHSTDRNVDMFRLARLNEYS